MTQDLEYTRKPAAKQKKKGVACLSVRPAYPMYLKSEVIVHQYTVTPNLEYTMNRNDTYHGVLGSRIIGLLNRRCQGEVAAGQPLAGLTTVARMRESERAA